ncbi:hypothetical protein ES705_47139 [subsurface metagenome]
MFKSNKEDEEKKMLAWFRGLAGLKRAEVLQPYFPEYDIKDMPLIMIFKKFNFNKRLEMYKKEQEKERR